MQNPDKFLIAIVIGMFILVAAVVLDPAPGYIPDDDPDGVVHNYFVAIQNEDYERAYGYLSPTLSGYPEDVDTFQRNVERLSIGYRRTSPTLLSIGSSQIIANQASVFANGHRFDRFGLFEEADFWDNRRSKFDFEVKLLLLEGDWKLLEADFSYFALCWTREDGCP